MVRNMKTKAELIVLTKAELIAENDKLKAELFNLKKKFKYSQELVEAMREKWINERDLCDRYRKEINVGNEIIKNQMKLLSSRKKSLLQRWLGI